MKRNIGTRAARACDPYHPLLKTDKTDMQWHLIGQGKQVKPPKNAVTSANARLE